MSWNKSYVRGGADKVQMERLIQRVKHSWAAKE